MHVPRKKTDSEIMVEFPLWCELLDVVLVVFGIVVSVGSNSFTWHEIPLVQRFVMQSAILWRKFTRQFTLTFGDISLY
jgi:hypothetical protein